MLTIKELREENLLSEMKLLHFHIGSQISDIKVIKDFVDHSAGDFRSQKWKDHVFVGQKLEDYIEVKV